MKTMDKTRLEAGIEARLRGFGLAAAVSLLLSGTALAAEHDRWTHEKEFVPNPSCTIGDAWDPDVDRPSHTALRQLAPSHNMLRIGVTTTNGPSRRRLDRSWSALPSIFRAGWQ